MVKLSSGEPWTVAEYEKIEENYKKENGLDVCCALLPDRSRKAICAQASKLGLTSPRKSWSAQELINLEEGSYNKISRSYSAKRIAASRHGIKKKYKGKKKYFYKGEPVAVREAFDLAAIPGLEIGTYQHRVWKYVKVGGDLVDVLDDFTSHQRR